MLSAALSGKLHKAEFVEHPVFGVAMPKSCPGVPPEVLDPRGMWKDPKAYDQGALELAARFEQNFEKFADAPPAVRAAGPRTAKAGMPL
jgi:phosphoenolpyruvate carboxykinase (ATP)